MRPRVEAVVLRSHIGSTYIVCNHRLINPMLSTCILCDDDDDNDGNNATHVYKPPSNEPN